MPHDPTTTIRRFRVSDRVFWAGVALACAGILSSSAGSQRAAPPANASGVRTVSVKTPKTAAADSVVTPDVLRTRVIEVTDSLGKPRIRMMVRADGEAVLEFVRPGSSAPTLALYDMLKGRPISGSQAQPIERQDGLTGIHVNGPGREGQYGLVQIERTGGSDAVIRIARGNATGATQHATLEADAVRFLQSGAKVKARVYGVEP
jgi:hypothetical protein